MPNEINELREQIINLYNSDDFKKLSRYYKKKSFFNILGISRKETIHSYFLHWLLSPSESHELGDYPLRRLLSLLALTKNKSQAQNELLQFPDGIEDSITVDAYSLDHIICERERVATAGERLDLFLSFDFNTEQMSKRLNIIIENKVKSKEGKEQTNRYYDYGESLDGETIYVFLSPLSNGDFETLMYPRCECKRFMGLNYQYLVDFCLEPCLSECTVSDAKVFIEEYLRTLSQPSLQFEDTDGGEVIMAVSAKERELLLGFWENNKDLLTAALNALADNSDLEQEERDQIRGSLQAINKASNKDYGAYLFDGETFGKGRLVPAVVKKYVGEHTEITLEELQKAFNVNGFNLVVPLSEARETLETTGRNRHFLDDVIILRDGEAAVYSQWSAANIGSFLEIADKLGYEIAPIKQTDEIKQIIRQILSEAKTEGAEYVDVRAGDVIRDHLNNVHQKNPMVCRAMHSFKKDGDEVLQSPPSGLGSSLKIRYYLQ